MKTQAEILLIEDNPAEANLMKEALKTWQLPTNIQVINYGDDALKYLRKEEPHTLAKTPDLIFLDLNLPRKHGREILREIKGDPNLRSIPVLILTVSESETDIAAAYNLGASSYIKKTLDFNQFLSMIQKIEDYWFNVVTLAKGPHE